MNYIKLFEEFEFKGSGIAPKNLIEVKMLGKSLDEILKNLSYKDNIPVDADIYDAFINYVDKGGSWTTSSEQYPTLKYCFLEAWGYLKQTLKIDYDLCMEMYNEINTISRHYMGNSKNYIKLQKDFIYTIGLCKNGAEYFYALYNYCKVLAMDYPFSLYKVIEKNFGKLAVKNIKIFGNVVYMLGVDSLTSALFK